MSFLRITDSVNSWVRFAMPSSALLTWCYEIRTTDNSGGTLANIVALSNNFFRAAWASGSGLASRSNRLIVNGTTVTPLLTRSQLSALLCTGNWITVQYTAHSAAASEIATTVIPSGTVIEFANYELDSASCPNADIRNFKCDVGNTGAWTHESYLGNSNGFSRQNAAILEAGGGLINSKTLIRPASSAQHELLIQGAMS